MVFTFDGRRWRSFTYLSLEVHSLHKEKEDPPLLESRESHKVSNVTHVTEYTMRRLHIQDRTFRYSISNWSSNNGTEGKVSLLTILHVPPVTSTHLVWHTSLSPNSSFPVNSHPRTKGSRWPKVSKSAVVTPTLPLEHRSNCSYDGRRWWWTSPVSSNNSSVIHPLMSYPGPFVTTSREERGVDGTVVTLPVFGTP